MSLIAQANRYDAEGIHWLAAELYEQAGAVALEHERYEDAIEAFEYALDSTKQAYGENREKVKSHVLLARALQEAGQRERAKKEFAHAIAITIVIEDSFLRSQVENLL